MDQPDWIAWQRDHTDALQALQDAQRVYHRAASERAFAAADETVARQARQALQLVDLARRCLDEVHELHRKGLGAQPHLPRQRCGWRARIK